MSAYIDFYFRSEYISTKVYNEIASYLQNEVCPRDVSIEYIKGIARRNHCVFFRHGENTDYFVLKPKNPYEGYDSVDVDMGERGVTLARYDRVLQEVERAEYP